MGKETSADECSGKPAASGRKHHCRRGTDCCTLGRSALNHDMVSKVVAIRRSHFAPVSLKQLKAPPPPLAIHLCVLLLDGPSPLDRLPPPLFELMIDTFCANKLMLCSSITSGRRFGNTLRRQ